MIWPGRTFVLAALIPALMSLVLLTRGSGPLKPYLLGLDALVAIVALVDLTTLRGANRLRASRSSGRVASLNEPQSAEITIENPTSAPRTIEVTDDLPETFVADPERFHATIPARGTAVLEYSFTPKRRGSATPECVFALVTSRWRFWRRSVRLPAISTINVYPDVRQIARYSLLARRGKLSAIGVRKSRKTGTDNEFERLRDYTEGDEPRHLDWRATARRRKLTVRTHQVSQSQRVIFLIDCGRMMAGDTGLGLSPLDHALNAMLMLAHVALVRGDQVGILAYADRVRCYVPPSGGPKRINRLVHAVHNLFPELVESRHDRAFVELERRSRKRSLVVLLTNVFDNVGAEQVVGHLTNIAGRHLPLAVFLRDKDLFQLADDPVTEGPRYFQAAGAAAMLNWRESVLATLRQTGALTLDVDPTELTGPLINRYLEIKARHLL